MEGRKEYEVMVLTLSQMGFCFFGIFLNNLVFITLKDLPDHKASTHNVVLTHITFVNLLICTFVKPVSAIYVAYSHAKGSGTVSLAFCLVYTVSSWATLTILPWSVCILAWHNLLGGRRAKERALGIPEHATNVFGNMSLASVFIATQSDGLEIVQKPSEEEKRKRTKKQTMIDGPRQPQTTFLAALWIGAGLVGAIRYLYSQSGEFPRVSRQYIIRPHMNSSEIIQVTRDSDTTFCKILGPELGKMDLLIIGLVCVVPMTLGPVLTAFIEIFGQCSAAFTDSMSSPPRWREFGLIHSLTLLVLLTYLTNLVGAEYIVGTMYGMSMFQVLMAKYIAGYLDLLLAPLVMILWDTEIRKGIPTIYRMKRSKTDDNESGIGM